MEKHAIDIGDRGKLVPEKVDFASMYHPGDVTIACSIRKEPNSGVHDDNRGLVRKMADSILYFITDFSDTKPFSRRRLD